MARPFRRDSRLSAVPAGARTSRYPLRRAKAHRCPLLPKAVETKLQTCASYEAWTYDTENGCFAMFYFVKNCVSGITGALLRARNKRSLRTVSDNGEFGSYQSATIHRLNFSSEGRYSAQERYQEQAIERSAFRSAIARWNVARQAGSPVLLPFEHTRVHSARSERLLTISVKNSRSKASPVTSFDWRGAATRALLEGLHSSAAAS